MQLLQKNGQISSINGTAEEQVELSLKPENLNGQQTEVVVTDGKETSTVIGDLALGFGKGDLKLGPLAFSYHLEILRSLIQIFLCAPQNPTI